MKGGWRSEVEGPGDDRKAMRDGMMIENGRGVEEQR